MDVDKSRVFIKMIAAMAEFREVFHRDIEKSFVAELYVAEKLSLTVNLSATEQGFDAMDKNGQRYQIKCRDSKTLNVDINNFDFDYIALVNLDNSYQLAGIWLATVSQVQEISTWREKYRKYQVGQNRFKKIAKRIT